MKQYYALTTDQVTELESQNQQIVRKLAGECMVVLENDGTLPLSHGGRKIALYGNGARHTVKGGTGSGDVNTREVFSVEQGLEEAGFEIVSREWLDEYDETLTQAQEIYIKEIRQISEEQHVPSIMVMFEHPFPEPDLPGITEDNVGEADTAIYVLARNSGEGADRKNEAWDYLLSESEEKTIRFLSKHYEKFIVLLNVGGVIDTAVLKSIEGINALVLIGQTGNIGGLAVADVLTGKTLPSGRLTDTWALKYSDYASSADFSHNNGNVDDEYYTEGIYVGYRYFDTFRITPAYCFGYGKGYTDFSYRVLSVEADEQMISVQTEVENTGKTYAGREIIQVYASKPEGVIEKPWQELTGFGKTVLLQPGEKDVLTICFPTASLASYSTIEAAWMLEAGTYTIRVGVNSRDTRIAAIITLDQTVKTKQLRNVFSEDDSVEEIHKPENVLHNQNKGDQDVISLCLKSSAFITEEVVYQEERTILKDHHPNAILTLDDVQDGRASLEDLTAQLTVEEMAALCVGAFCTEQEANVVGSASATVPGAAGETVDIISETRGVPSLILADGPAGLRLQPHFKTTRSGELLKGGEVFGMEVCPFPENTTKEAVDYYQYCTAIPIATTLAQSWDMELIEQMGHIVGSEMKRYHVHLWLAPGMNIHRNPLCGRNFEYYSEDPLLSGKCAAADTKGVQSWGKQGTAIKHFAANNQEDNRMFNNAHITERALREIYLKGFEIAVKESQPYSIMTSYNLINGTHAANHYGLLQTVARDEWGFEGVVMTDWYTSQNTEMMGVVSDIYPCSSSPLCIKAGNDLQMPGCKENVEDIIEAVRENKEITLGDLQFCAVNILRTILMCK